MGCLMFIKSRIQSHLATIKLTRALRMKIIVVFLYCIVTIFNLFLETRVSLKADLSVIDSLSHTFISPVFCDIMSGILTPF